MSEFSEWQGYTKTIILRLKNAFLLTYLLWAAEHMTLRTSDPQLKNTPLLLKNPSKKSDWHWRKLLVDGMWSPPSLVSLIYLCNDVPVLSVNLSNGPKVSDDTEDLVDLKVNDTYGRSLKDSQLSKVGQATERTWESESWKMSL